MKTTARTPARNAFTLVELLVVVGIIAVLAALLTPAVMKARSAARNAAIKAEIDMLHMAIMNYKNEYGSFPPCQSTEPNLGPAVRHLMRIFPRTGELVPNRSDPQQPGLLHRDQLDSAATGKIPGRPEYVDNTNLNNISFGPATAIVFWLEGFTQNPASPMAPAAERKKLFDFDESRKISSGNPPKFTGLYHIAGKPESPYIYIDSRHYATLAFTGGSTPGAMRQSFNGDPSPFANTTRPFFNADTFQILCAGVDGVFGTDDDLSNFWKGTRREYLDSLQGQ